MAEIIFDNVTKRFPDGTLGLHKTNFKINDGEFFILVGPSGCGKSTLLNMLVGLEDISEGEIRVNGKSVNDVDPKDRNMAMVFQSYALYPHMSVRQNIAFPLKLAKTPKDEIERRVEQTAEILELTELLERKPRNLSGGQRQRVAMARALIRRPEVFLLDEPLSNLDAKLRGQMRVEIERIQKRMGITTVYVTHDQTEAMTLGDRIAVLRQGRIQQIGTPRELYVKPCNVFVAGFLGSPPMNFLPAKLEVGHINLPLGKFKLPDEMRKYLSDKPLKVIAGIRPEDIRIVSSNETESSFGCLFKTNVERVEWLGADLLIHFEIESGNLYTVKELTEVLDIQPTRNGRLLLVARIMSARPIEVGQSIELCLNLSNLHLFDASTGASLCSSD
jgi:multiple sugar transport system ATP-binding protein